MVCFDKINVIIPNTLSFGCVSGIPVKFQRTENYVHHKFCLLDTDASLKQQDVVPPTGARRIPNSGALMAGSMNWTLQV